MAVLSSRASPIYNLLLRQWKTSFARQHQRHQTSIINENQGSTVTILNEDTEAGILINAYSRAGFRLNNGMMALGPIAVFPKTVLSWNVSGHEDIDEESLSLFVAVEPKIDILVIGVGDLGNRLSPSVVQYIRSKNINMEMLPTERACAVFNFLNVENRNVAAALIPPLRIKIGEDDIATHMRNTRNFLVARDE